MWHDFHSFLYQNQWIGLVVALGGTIYALFLYVRALRAVLAPRPAAAGAGTGAPGTERQHDLLGRLGSDSQDQLATERIGYGVDPDSTTRINDQLDPQYRSTALQDRPESAPSAADGLQQAIRAAVEESLREDSAPAGADEEDDARSAVAESDEASPDDWLGLGTATEEPDAPADEAPVDEAPVDETPAGEPTTEEIARRRYATHTELLRRAQRHEDLGLHYYIEPDQVGDSDQQAPAAAAGEGEGDGSGTAIADQEEAALDENAKAQRLSELGLAEGSDPDEAERLATTDLDDILSRLDEALGGSEEEEDDNAPPTAIAERPDAPQAAEAEVAAEPPGAAEGDAEPSSEAAHAAKGKPSVPAWARADTFDEDLDRDGDDEDPVQEKLF